MDPREACEVCEQALQGGRCPSCGEAERARLRALEPGAFPATALPPAGLNAGARVPELRRAILGGDWGRAEPLWEELLRSLRPLGERGRRQLAQCFDACAGLKQALGKAEEAARLRQRALSLRKAPSELLRHAPMNPGPGWDNHAWVRSQAGEALASSPEAAAKGLRDLERMELRAGRRRLGLGLGLGAFSGWWCAIVIGLPVWALAPLGALGGWLWARRA